MPRWPDFARSRAFFLPRPFTVACRPCTCAWLHSLRATSWQRRPWCLCHAHSLTHSLTSGYLCPERRLELAALRQHAQPPVASGFESALRAPGNKGFVNVVQQHSVLIQHSTRTILHWDNHCDNRQPLGQPTHASGVTTRRDPLCTSSPWPCSFCSSGATGSVARQDAPLRTCPTKTILQ